MPAALLVNPKKRSAKKRRKNPIANLGHHAKKGGAKKRRKNPAAAPARSAKKRRRNPVAIFNPSKRRRYKRNPIGLSVKGVMETLKPGLQGAGGALALDLFYGYVPVPQKLRAGILGQVVKGGVAIGIGMAAQKFSTPAIGRNMALGALTVTFRDIARGLLNRYAPGVRLADVDDALEDAALDDYLELYNAAPVTVDGFQAQDGNPMNGYELNGPEANPYFDPSSIVDSIPLPMIDQSGLTLAETPYEYAE